MEGSVNQKIKDQIKVETLFEYLFELKEQLVQEGLMQIEAQIIFGLGDKGKRYL